MRRTQARQTTFGPLNQPVLLEATPCRVCGELGATIVALGRNSNGAIEMAWCTPAHAVLEGWPFLQSERDEPADERQADIFGLETADT